MIIQRAHIRCASAAISVAFSTVFGLASAWGQIQAMPLNTAERVETIRIPNPFELGQTSPGVTPAVAYTAVGSPLSNAGSALFAGHTAGMSLASAAPFGDVRLAAATSPALSPTPAATIELVAPDSTSGPLYPTMGPVDYGQSFPMQNYLTGQQGGYQWQLLPTGLMYPAYLAGGRESRFASHWVRQRNRDWVWDVTLGGRAGILRYGTDDPIYPEGWQLDIEGAAFPRLDLESDRDMVSADFRFGVPLTRRSGRWEWKLAYYHLSSHLGDEYMITHPGARRLNYVRDCIVFGSAFRLAPDFRLYAEADYSFYNRGGSRPWAFQFGLDWSQIEPTSLWGSPFFAINAHLRQENDFGGNLTVQTGWQWRGQTGHLFRVGLEYLDGMSDQAQFYDRFEQQIGVGLWYDY